MNDYVYGCDVVGADDGEYPDAVSALIKAEKPMKADRAQALISYAMNALAEMNFYDKEEESAAWRDDMAGQLARMSEAITADTIPDKAVDVLARAISSIAEMLDEGAQIYPDFEHAQDRLLQSMGARVHVLGTTLGPRGRIVGMQEDDEAFFEEIAGSFEYDAARTGMQDDFVIVEPNQPSGVMNLRIEDVLGELETVVGMFDIAVAQRSMNTLKPVTVGIAKALIKGGQRVITVAQTVSRMNDLPNTNTLEMTAGHLRWHADKLAGLKDDKAAYAHGDDAKKWAMQAFIESNATEEGVAYLDEAWSQMWAEIGERLKELPAEISRFAMQLPGKILEAGTGVPWWLWYVGGAALVGLVGYGAYRILAGPSAAAFVGHYLGARRR